MGWQYELSFNKEVQGDIVYQLPHALTIFYSLDLYATHLSTKRLLEGLKLHLKLHWC